MDIELNYIDNTIKLKIEVQSNENGYKSAIVSHFLSNSSF